MPRNLNVIVMNWASAWLFPLGINEFEGQRAGPTRRPAWRAGGEGPSRVWFCTWWTVHSACPDRPHHLPLSRADLLLNVHETPSWATTRKEGMAWYSSRPMPSLWYLSLYIYVHSVCMYDLIRGSLRTYTKDLTKARCVHYDIRKYLSCQCYFSFIPGAVFYFFSIAQTILLTSMCPPTGLSNFLAFNFRLWSTVLRQEGVGKRALLYPLVRASVTAHARRRGWRIELEKVHLLCAPALSLSAHEVSISLARSPRYIKIHGGIVRALVRLWHVKRRGGTRSKPAIP